jgi:hypothetical protein
LTIKQRLEELALVKAIDMHLAWDSSVISAEDVMELLDDGDFTASFPLNENFFIPEQHEYDDEHDIATCIRESCDWTLATLMVGYELGRQGELDDDWND